MQFGIRYTAFFVLICALSIGSCKKKDSVPPNVAIYLPAEGQLFNVFDTVTTQFSVDEETNLEYVSAQIVDDNFIPIGQSQSINFNEIFFSRTADLVLENKLLETGDYYVLITASDGTNETREFRKIGVIALPKKKRGIFFSTAAPSNQIWKIDSLFQGGVSWLSPSQDMRKLCVNSLNDRLTFIGEFSTEVQSYDINSVGMVWSDNTANVNQIQRFTDLLCYENATYVGLFDKELRAYNLNGSRTLGQLTGNYRTETIYADRTFLLVEMQLVGDNSYHLFVFNRQTEAQLWQLEIPMNVEAICALQDDEVVLFGNDNGQARVLHYDIGENGWWEPRNLPTGILTDAVRTEAGNFAIAHEDGLYSYTYNPNFLNMLSADKYQDIVFDVDNNTIVGAMQSTVNEVSVVNGAMINSFSQGDSITSLDIFYTR